jgi:hypothetical protein
MISVVQAYAYKQKSMNLPRIIEQNKFQISKQNLNLSTIKRIFCKQILNHQNPIYYKLPIFSNKVITFMHSVQRRSTTLNLNGQDFREYSWFDR